MGDTAVAEAPPAEPTPAYNGEAEATRSTSELFQWSGYVHVGRGAEECEHRADGACEEAEHFHAWLCLPNPFQIRDITDKARAAKARKQRALREKGSDLYEVLEADLRELRYDRYDELVEALAAAEVDRRLPDIVRELQDDERFEHYAQDAEEFRRLRELPEDERDAEEWTRLEADMQAYGHELEEAVRRERQSERERLEALPADEVIDRERRSRIENIGTEVYLHTYYTWAMFIGTRKPSNELFPSQRRFASPEELRDAPPEVVIKLREKIGALESQITGRGDAAGNS